MPATISITAPGFMGAGIGGKLVEHGAEVRTLLEGRSQASADRAHAAGMKGVDIAAFCDADVILSILPPANAIEIARKVAPLLNKQDKPAIYADLNAVSPETASQIGSLFGPSVCYVDGSIIGMPPDPTGKVPTIYLSGSDAPRLAYLNDLGLKIRVIDADIGAASALKMCYGGLTKGFVAMISTLALAAEKAGISEQFRQELRESQPGPTGQLERSIPAMYGRAYRWGAEMSEISAFLGKDQAGADVYQGFAEIFDRLAADHAGSGEEISLLQRFLDR